MTTVDVTEQVVSVVEVTETEAVIQTVDRVQVIEMGIAGPQGVPGPTGPVGPVGGAYEHTQAVAADVWTIVHNLGYRPNVHIQDTLGRDVVGDVSHTDINTMVLTFSALLTGSATLS